MDLPNWLRILLDVGAALMLACLPPAIIFWLLIHPFTDFWRRIGPTATYVASGVVYLGLAALIWSYRDVLLATHWGYRPATIAAGLILYLGAMVWDKRVLGKLGFRLLVGLPEISAKHPTTLRTDGPYAKVRHPRYLGALIGITGFALIVNYPALYLVLAASIPVGWLLIVLEERELEGRFGDEYRAYRERVPRIVPRFGG